MKTILHITEVSSGGVLPMIANICNGLVNEYHIIVSYGIRFDTPDNIREYFDKRIELIPLPMFKRDLSIKNDVRTIYEIGKIVRKYQPEIIHMHSTKAGLLGRITFLFYKGKKFYTPHGYSFLKQDVSVIKGLLYKIVELILAHMNCTTIACGLGELEYAQKLNRNAICINNGIDIAWIETIINKTEIKKHDFTVYTAGRIGPQKNPELFNSIAESCPDIRFIWMGEGEGGKYLTSPNIIVTGLLDRNKLIEMAVNCDCYISCSLWEGLPVALLEAMYLKKACIVSNVIGNKDLIEDGVTGYIANIKNDYVESIYRVKRNSSQFSENAHGVIVKEYNMKSMCENYRAIYNVR